MNTSSQPLSCTHASDLWNVKYAVTFDSYKVLSGNIIILNFLFMGQLILGINMARLHDTKIVAKAWPCWLRMILEEISFGLVDCITRIFPLAMQESTFQVNHPCSKFLPLSAAGLDILFPECLKAHTEQNKQRKGKMFSLLELGHSYSPSFGTLKLQVLWPLHSGTYISSGQVLRPLRIMPFPPWLISFSQTELHLWLLLVLQHV